jgi:hypothetical protein
MERPSTREIHRMRLAVLLAAAALAAPAHADPASEAARAYTVEASVAPAGLKVGETGALRVAIKPAPKAHVHPEAPLKVTLSATPGLTLAKQKVGRAELSDPRAEAPRFEVAVTGAVAGKQQASAMLDFFICSDAWCVKQVREVKVDVDVK